MKAKKAPTTRVGAVITEFMNTREVSACTLGEMSRIPSCTITSYRTGGLALKPSSKHVRRLAVAMGQPYKDLKNLAKADTQDRTTAIVKAGSLRKRTIAPKAVATTSTLEAKVDALQAQVKRLTDLFRLT